MAFNELFPTRYAVAIFNIAMKRCFPLSLCRITWGLVEQPVFTSGTAVKQIRIRCLRSAEGVVTGLPKSQSRAQLRITSASIATPAALLPTRGTWSDHLLVQNCQPGRPPRYHVESGRIFIALLNFPSSPERCRVRNPESSSLTTIHSWLKVSKNCWSVSVNCAEESRTVEPCRPLSVTGRMCACGHRFPLLNP